MVAEFGMPGTALYGASKAALVLLTKAWAAEFGPSGVRINAVNAPASGSDMAYLNVATPSLNPGTSA